MFIVMKTHAYSFDNNKLSNIQLTRRSRAGGNPGEYDINLINDLLDTRLREYDGIHFMFIVLKTPAYSFDNNRLSNIL